MEKISSISALSSSEKELLKLARKLASSNNGVVSKSLVASKAVNQGIYSGRGYVKKKLRKMFNLEEVPVESHQRFSIKFTDLEGE